MVYRLTTKHLPSANSCHIIALHGVILPESVPHNRITSVEPIQKDTSLRQTLSILYVCCMNRCATNMNQYLTVDYMAISVICNTGLDILWTASHGSRFTREKKQRAWREKRLLLLLIILSVF